jgi:imidazolonepropionase-like amidohydrolase
MRLLPVTAAAFLLAACAPAAAPPAAPPPVAGPAPTSTPQVSPAPGAATTAGLPFLTVAPKPLGTDRVAFKLFKFLGETGAERDTYVALPGGGVEAKALFSYRDRMSTVPVAATFAIAPDGALRRYAAWGKTSRFTTIDDAIVVHGDTVDVTREDGHTTTRAVPPGVVGVASGYAPMLAQDLLLREWGQRGRPHTMSLLPEGEATIESRGKETYENGKEKVTLEHVAIGGLVWGREDAWIAGDGTLVAVVTRDAEFDHSEAVREGFDAILPQLAKSTGADGVAWLAEQARGLRRGTGPLALVGGTVIDGRGGPPLKDAVVIVDGDRIVAVGSRASVTVPAGATSVDVAGKYLVPGLWDMHAHVEQVEQGAVYLAAGVTTVRDMGNILDFITGMRDAIDAGNGLGPRILVDGLVDGEGPAALGTVRIASRDQIAPTLDRLKKAGCPEVKIYSSVAPDLVRPIVAYAHAHGMRAVGHVPEGMTSAEAIDAGYDSISHITYLLDAALPSKERRSLSRAQAYERMAAIDLASPPMAKLLARLAARHVVIDDTMALEEQVFHTPEEDAKREPGIATLPKELAATLGGVPPALAPDADAAFEKLMALLRELHRRNVPVVAGTDITVPGHSLLRELELYVKAGWTPMEALEAATSLPAKVMHLDRELGTLQAGKRADLVVLDADPLADIRNVRRTALVVTRGKAYAPDGLWKLVGFRPHTHP